MFLTDKVSTSKVRRSADGYLIADAKVARTGVQVYLGSEVGRPEMQTVRLYRPPEEVFHRDSLASYAHKPATNDHPAAMVDANTWKATSIGQIGEEIVRDGDHVRVPLILMDGAAIRDYEAGKRELSMGYSAEIMFDSGTTPQGEAYDAVQRNIRINHIALVAKGRAGSARIGDGRAPGDDGSRDDNTPSKRNPPMSDTKTVLVDGLSVVTTDAGAQAIAKLQQTIQDNAAAAAEALADRDAKLAKAEAERDAAQAKVLSDADIDARVNARADLIGKAKVIADADYTGKSDADIRKAAVVAKLGDAAVAGKSDAYIEARFDILVDDAKADPVSKTLKQGVAPVAVKDNGYAASVADFDRNRTKKEA